MTIAIIALIGMETHWLVGLALFMGLIVLPTAYLGFVYYLGTALAIRGDMRGAITHYSRVLAVNERFKLPINRLFIYTRRAALRNAIGDLNGAISDYTAAIDHASYDIPALYGIRSALYLGKHDYEAALADSDRLLKLQPRSEVGFANRAAARMFLGDTQGAIDDCNQGLETSQLNGSGKALLYNNRGTAYRIQGEYTEAMANYNLAMSAKLKPRQKRLILPSVMTNQGILYYLMQEIDNARVYFQHALDTNPNFYKAMAGLAISRFKLGQASEAQQVWQHLLIKEPRYRDLTTLQHDLNLPLQMMHDVSELVNY